MDQAANAFEAAHAAIPSCALTPEGVQDQRRRQQIVAPSVAGSTRSRDRLVISFNEDYDSQVLEDMIAIESECCPFFVFDLDVEARRLEVGVRSNEYASALDAIAALITGA